MFFPRSGNWEESRINLKWAKRKTAQQHAFHISAHVRFFEFSTSGFEEIPGLRVRGSGECTWLLGRPSKPFNDKTKQKKTPAPHAVLYNTTTVAVIEVATYTYAYTYVPRMKHKG
ncbi:hypothetical protein ACJQWK_06793 [Exserohilum turcicum]